MLNVDHVLAENYPKLQEHTLISSLLRPFLRYMLYEKAFIGFAEDYPYLQGIEFVEQALEYFDFSYVVSDRERENIPVSGKVVIIANHPIGSLDGLALLKLVHEVRSDVKIVANDLLMSIAPLQSCLLPVKNMTGGSGRTHIQKIHDTLHNDSAVIIFPAGEVSRLGPNGIRDGKWLTGFEKFASRTKSPILPIHISGRNSLPFYLTSILAKPLSTLMLVGEMFRQQRKEIKLTIGELISFDAYSNVAIQRKDKVKLLKKHLYRIGSGKKSLFATETSIARPERKADLKHAMQDGERLGVTPDGKTIFLFATDISSPIIREVGRLREHAFRAVGEGTGRRRDLDKFDRYYQHLILWDEDDLEIAGAYRFVDAGKVACEQGIDGLYSGSLFNFNSKKAYFLENGLELGRSFVQQRYWGKRSLDYLWYGIGGFLRNNPEYKYLFGPVSISNSMPQLAKDLMIYFYQLYFTTDKRTSFSRNPFTYSRPVSQLGVEFSGNDYKADFKRLKLLLKNLGCAVPPLYKQYTELCEPGGVQFLDFNVDPDFNNCVDGLVIVDVDTIKKKKRKRYIEDTILH